MKGKAPGLQAVFADVAGTYDLANHVLTLGLDIPWRRRAARAAARLGGKAWLDVCSGPGEMARALARIAPPGVRVIAVDFTPAMVRASIEGARRDGVRFVLSEAAALPFPDETFDLVTISFATRNINTGRELLLRRFRDFRRVLKPGGSFLNLETSQPPRALVRFVFHAYIGTVVKPLGSLLSGSKAGYAYLSSTIPRFYDAEQLTALILEAGFGSVSVNRFFWGAAAMHLASK
jgi:demethylmenaquinone methyltransferase/2-methoxy-6-polyprenyl-1,4-benzoquinol methylase